MKNLVLIGMPGCGKTTVGQLLTHALALPLVDTDAMVVQMAGKTIAQIFSEEGERAFRDRESDAVRQAAAMPGAVIATGGGVITRHENMEELGRSGHIFFIDRLPEEIAAEDHSGRPLLDGDRDKIFKLYAARIALYRRYGAHHIVGATTAEEVADRIVDIWSKMEEHP